MLKLAKQFLILIIKIFIIILIYIFWELLESCKSCVIYMHKPFNLMLNLHYKFKVFLEIFSKNTPWCKILLESRPTDQV